jgi:hypothetical protein
MTLRLCTLQQRMRLPALGTSFTGRTYARNLILDQKALGYKEESIYALRPILFTCKARSNPPRGLNRSLASVMQSPSEVLQ